MATGCRYVLGKSGGPGGPATVTAVLVPSVIRDQVGGAVSFERQTDRHVLHNPDAPEY